MRTCFICAINNEAILKSVFREKEEKLTFAKAVEIATEIEEAAKTAKAQVYSKPDEVQMIHTKKPLVANYKSANYYLHCIRKIRNFISMDACKLLVHTLVMVRLDYCNALLCGAREDVIRQLERLQRQAARVVCKKYKNDHTSVTELMWGLHWLPIRARIQYKILLLVYKAFTNGSPTYLADMMTSCNPVRSTRSSHKVNLLVVPHQKSNKYSEKAFAVVGPRLWNELLTDELRGCNSVDTFKKKLKTMLFKKHY